MEERHDNAGGRQQLPKTDSVSNQEAVQKHSIIPRFWDVPHKEVLGYVMNGNLQPLKHQ